MGILIYLTYFISHSYTELINPGYPKHDLDSKTGEPRSRYEYCPICRMWVSKEKKTKHIEIRKKIPNPMLYFQHHKRNTFLYEKSNLFKSLLYCKNSFFKKVFFPRNKHFLAKFSSFSKL